MPNWRLFAALPAGERRLLHRLLATFAAKFLDIDQMGMVSYYSYRTLALWKWAEYELARSSSEKGKRMWQEARSTFERLDLQLFVAQMEIAG